jgi:hypothetical protein
MVETLSQLTPRYLNGYTAASQFTGIHARRLRRLVESRQIRAIKPNTRAILFHVGHLEEDLLAMEGRKSRECSPEHRPHKRESRA